jgi:F-type H+-transporting ATPase subunit alpha
VARTLKLDMARYNELAAFAQFASDLDAQTQRTLNRGQHLVELLKQPQYSPLAEGDQVYVVYAGTSGLLDDVPLDRVAAFETGLKAYMADRYPDLSREIFTKGALSEASTKTMQAGVAEFKAQFMSAKTES